MEAIKEAISGKKETKIEVTKTKSQESTEKKKK